jgi:hypothetical protein
VTGIATGPEHPLAGPAGVRRGPAGPAAGNSLARWGGRRLGFPTPYSNHLSREPILDGLLSDEPGLATLVPRAGNAVPPLGRLLAILWVRDGLRGATQFDVRSPSVSIGRDHANDVVLDSPAVGAHHASLSLAGGVWTLTNLEATNGTWVDGARVEDSIALAPGSEVRIAGVVLSFAPRDTWSDSPVSPKPERPAPALSGPLFLVSDEATKPSRMIVRAAVVLIVCLLAYILLAGR